MDGAGSVTGVRLTKTSNAHDFHEKTNGHVLIQDAAIVVTVKCTLAAFRLLGGSRSGRRLGSGCAGSSLYPNAAVNFDPGAGSVALSLRAMMPPLPLGTALTIPLRAFDPVVLPTE